MPPTTCDNFDPSRLSTQFVHSGNSDPREISTFFSHLGVILKEPSQIVSNWPPCFLAPYFQQLNNGESIPWLRSGVMILSKVQLYIIRVQNPRHLPPNVRWIKPDCLADASKSVSTWWPIQEKQRCVIKNILVKKIFSCFTRSSLQ